MWCLLKYWYNIVKRGITCIYKTSENTGLTFAHRMVCTPLPLKGSVFKIHIIFCIVFCRTIPQFGIRKS